MGYSLSWLAVKGKSRDEVLDALGFIATDEREDFPEAPLSAAELPNGWFLVVRQREEHDAQDPLLPLLSQGCVVVTCSVEEHVMFSSAACWKDGKESWYVEHNGQRSRDHLAFRGEKTETARNVSEARGKK
jgi:hypothetical protein